MIIVPCSERFVKGLLRISKANRKIFASIKPISFNIVSNL
ncbi:hypothetical protein RU89_GL000406 [Lactococcus cremoris]|uniref:Uncharacterized protein n=1 Tax=Lactococcus cremoris subsp. tructae TaxID=542833 RepID=A0A2A5SVR1_LACLC|nr:hypothetical protein llh_7670 [Lactococcus cremoris subsp. cremoris A76]KZK12881.1 hypothetical protein AB995_0944 [Lactococcus cremoris]PCS19968.1 hypothetical protein RU92_GL001486 [Lactococcus cremoris subsp. tructae]KZK42735.1 hypothetical protein LMG6897_0496 [Lactococcus cremoris]KZK46697.1 hypothetical protein SK110_1496 [Lactococcus cremoris]